MRRSPTRTTRLDRPAAASRGDVTLERVSGDHVNSRVQLFCALPLTSPHSIDGRPADSGRCTAPRTSHSRHPGDPRLSGRTLRRRTRLTMAWHVCRHVPGDDPACGSFPGGFPASAGKRPPPPLPAWAAATAQQVGLEQIDQPSVGKSSRVPSVPRARLWQEPRRCRIDGCARPRQPPGGTHRQIRASPRPLSAY